MLSRFDSVPCHTLLRALAITLVVWNHTWLRIPTANFWFNGGMVILLVLAGWNFARFSEKEGGLDLAPEKFLRYAKAIALPTLAMLILLSPFRMQNLLSIQKILLIGNLIDNKSDSYWYVEAMVQMCLVLAVLFSWRGVRRQFRSRPLATAVAFYIGSLAACFGWTAMWHWANAPFVPRCVLWGFALGIVLHEMAKHGEAHLGRFWRLAAFGCIVVGAAVQLGIGQSDFWYLGAAGVMLIWVDAVELPQTLGNLCNTIGQATFAIYLLHMPIIFFAVRIVNRYACRGVSRLDACRDAPYVFLAWPIAMVSCIGLWMFSTALIRAYRVRLVAVHPIA